MKLDNIEPQNSPAVKLDSIGFAYVKNTPIIDIPTWQLNKSEHVFLYGPSGCGKSTLLSLLAGILVPQQGCVSILGEDIARLKNSKRDRFRAQHIGVVFQQFNLVPYLSVLDNIQLAMHFADESKSVSKRSNRERILNMLQALQLPAHCIEQQASDLSVGQQQRVAIARALINQPDVLIVDEPTSALDASAKDAFMNVLIESATKSQAALIFVSHDLDLAKHFTRVESLLDINQPMDSIADKDANK
jgi:putative ABC transport system ATP-binding protein